MRLKKLSLIAAAGLSAVVSLTAATPTATLGDYDVTTGAVTNTTNVTFGADLSVVRGKALTIDVTGAATWAGKVTGEVQNPNAAQPMLDPGFTSGTVIKTGDGTLQLDSYKNIAYYQGSFVLNTLPSSQVMLSDASQGMLRVKGGTVEVGGYLNQFVDLSDWGTNFTGLQFLEGTGTNRGFIGYGATVLEGNSRISFTNTPLNVPNALPSLDGAVDFPPLPRVKRLNFIVNLKAGDDHTEVNTRLNVGQTEDMRLICHVTEDEVQSANSTGMGVVGSVGILEGQGGMFIKTGGGEFRLLNKATFTGNVLVEEGTLVLTRENTLETARSVNLGSPDDPRGAVYIGAANGTGEISPYLVPHSPASPASGEYSAKLKVDGDQRINNLQALVKPVDSRGVIFSPSEVYGVRTGGSTAIDIADGKTLTINQVYNGYYTGKFISTYRAGDADLGSHAVGDERTVETAPNTGGNIVKYGVAETREDDEVGTVYTKGTLVLDGPGSIYRTLDIREGVVFANVQSLGSGDVYVQSGGLLKLIQNDVGTLKSRLHGVGTLTFSKIAYMMTNGSDLDGGDTSNGEPMLVFMGTGQIGTVDVFVSQDDFRGDIVVEDGLQLRFSSANGDAFRNANSLTLITGENGEETALTFNDTNQTFRNFSGERNTRVDLGQGNITIIQDRSDLAYEGKITGSGGLIKDGAKALTLNGRDEAGNSVTTYSGATVVKNGTLVLGGANQLPNSSGLVMLGGSVVVNGAQRFGALFGTAGSTLNMGANDLTIGVTDARLDQIRASTGALTTPNNSFYLATDGSTVLNGYTGQTTRNFLQSVGMSAADANTLAFAGTITGTGRLIKEGAERLILTGVNTYTGATLVNGGTLQVNIGSIDSSSSVTVAAGANFAVNVDSGSGEFNRVVSGAGNFEKTGAGTLTLGQDVYQYSGTTTVRGGTLVVTLNPAMTGEIRIAPGATLAANQSADTTFGTSIVSTVTGGGTFQKDGGGLLHLTNFSGFTGLARVNAGILRVNTLSPGSIEIASGATFEVTPSGPVPSYTGTVSGAGTLLLTGQSVTFGASSTGFTGKISAVNTTINAAVDDIFPAATFELANSVFSIDGTIQHIAAFTGDVASSVNLGSTGELHFSPDEGVVASFNGVINGSGGSIVKDGSGTQRLTTPVNTGWSGFTTVNQGTLVATVDALGNSVVTINTGTNLSAPGTLAFLNADSDNPSTYGGAISGDGVIGKTGVGVVNLTNASAACTGSIAVSQGELHVTSSGIGPSGNLFGRTSVATDAIYAVALSGNTAHDSSNTTNRVTDMITLDGVAQHGSLAVEGAVVFTLLNGQSYTGNTILRRGVTLDLVNSTGLNGVLNGLAGEADTTVRTDGAALTIVQSVDGTFSGAFNATTDLTVKGDGKLALDNVDNNIGAIVVDGGRLALDASLENGVSLINGGTLYFDTTTFNQVYQGPVTGDGNMLKTGDNTLQLLNTGDFTNLLGFTGGLGSDQGRLEVSVASMLAVAPNITKFISEGAGEVALHVDTGDTQSLTLAITGDGDYFKTGEGKLVLGTAENPYTIDATGTFTIEAGTLGGNFTTSGDLVVDTNGTLAPGNSPGTVTVNGNFTSRGTLALELNATTSDKIVVNGAVTLAAGTLFSVTQDNTPGSTAPVRGKAYQVITATGGIFAQEGDFKVDLSKRRVIILTPTRYNTLVAYNPDIPRDANSVYIFDAPSLAGFSPHDGLSGLVGVLDSYVVGGGSANDPVALGLPSNALGGALAFAPEGSIAQTVNNLSPLGYASLYTMSRDTALRQEDRLKERLEQRRYDNGGYSIAEWEAFVVGSAGMADNQVGSDTPVFDYKTYGGLVGLDKKIEDGLFVGGAAGYDNGTATLHQNGGKIEMNRVRGTAFMTTMVTKRWFVDAGLSAGFGDFTSKRETVLGRVTGSTTGFDLGLNVATGTVLVLREDLHLTPFVGVSYAHHEFQGFTEKGADSALKLDGWSQDSLRASFGTGLGWWVPAGDWKWKFGVDLAYNHELLDTESDIDARFARLGGDKFGTTAAALPADSLSVGPNVALHFDDDTSISGGVTFEYGFDGRTYGGLNIAFRRRF